MTVRGTHVTRIAPVTLLLDSHQRLTNDGNSVRFHRTSLRGDSRKPESNPDATDTSGARFRRMLTIRRAGFGLLCVR